MEIKRQKLIEFNDIKKDILKALEERLKELGISEQSVDLVDGFINQPFSMQLSKSIVIGGPTIPMIMLLGKKSGRIYFFALKALIPDIEV